MRSEGRTDSLIRIQLLAESLLRGYKSAVEDEPSLLGVSASEWSESIGLNILEVLDDHAKTFPQRIERRTGSIPSDDLGPTTLRLGARDKRFRVRGHLHALPGEHAVPPGDTVENGGSPVG